MDCVMVLNVVKNRKFLFDSQVRMHPPHKNIFLNVKIFNTPFDH
jgi:hypothetical protein